MPTTTKPQPVGLLWLDLETTGLDPEFDAVLEVAATIAPFDDPFAAARIIVDRPVKIFWEVEEWSTIVTSGRTITLSDSVRNMHEKNKLLRDCVGGAASTLEEIEGLLLEQVPDLPRDERFVLAGSTVHFDRSFLKAWMPRLERHLSHRHYDVSSIKLFCQSLGMEPFPKAEAHRAMADVRESIAHAELCRKWLADDWE
jgi:oligoribonuclease